MSRIRHRRPDRTRHQRACAHVARLHVGCLHVGCLHVARTHVAHVYDARAPATYAAGVAPVTRRNAATNALGVA